MPPSINANPPQVLFPSPDLGTLPQPTTISWNTGDNNIRGRVFLSLNGGPEEVFDGNARRSGTKVKYVQFGQVSEFRLRRDDAARTLLATVKVTTANTTGLPAVELFVRSGIMPSARPLPACAGPDAIIERVRISP